jgi:hypothetical protein
MWKNRSSAAASPLRIRPRRALRLRWNTLRSSADLPRLSVSRIAPAVEAGYPHNPLVLHLEEYAIRETPHSRTATAPRRLQGIARDVLRAPQPWPRPSARNAPRAPRGCCHTRPALPASPHSHVMFRRPGLSRFLKQSRPDFFPGDDIGGVLLVPS